MNWSLGSHAEAELEEAATFYRERAGAALAQEFVKEFERVANLLALNPKLGTPVTERLRKHPMRRFPYSVFYRILAGRIRVVVIGHQHRRPNYWVGRH